MRPKALDPGQAQSQSRGSMNKKSHQLAILKDPAAFFSVTCTKVGPKPRYSVLKGHIDIQNLLQLDNTVAGSCINCSAVQIYAREKASALADGQKRRDIFR